MGKVDASMKRDERVSAALTLVLLGLIAAPVMADWLSGEIQGSSPIMAVNPVTDHIYSFGSYLQETEGATGRFNGAWAIDPTPTGMVVNPVTNKVYVACYDDNRLIEFDPATQTMERIQVCYHPKWVVVNPVTNTAFVANFEPAGRLTIVNLATYDTSSVAADSYPQGLCVNPVTNKVYMGCNMTNRLIVYDAAADTTRIVAVPPHPYGPAVNVATNRVYVPCRDSICVLDGTNDSVIATVSNGSWNSTPGVDPAANLLYFMTGQYGTYCTILDGQSNSMIAADCDSGGYRVAVNPALGKGYVSNYFSSNATVLRGWSSTALATLPTPHQPRLAMANPVTGKAYVAADVATYTIDGSEQALSDSWDIGSVAGKVVANPRNGDVYAADYAGSTVFVVNHRTGETAWVSVGSRPGGIAVNPVSNKAYVTHWNQSVIVEIDGATRDTAVITVGSNGGSIVANPVTNKVYAYCAPNITVIDGYTRRIIKNIPVGNSMDMVALNPATNRLYVSNGDEFQPRVYVIDGELDSVVAAVTTGATPTGIGINRVTNRIYVACGANGEVTEIDGATNAAETYYAGSDNWRVAVDEALNKVYLTCPQGHSVTVIDEANPGITEVALSGAPGEIAVNPVSGLVYVPLSGVDSLAVIDGIGLGTHTVHAGGGPNCVAIDPVTDNVYLTSANTGVLRTVREWPNADTKLHCQMERITGDTTSQSQLTFTGTAANRFTPYKSPMIGAYIRQMSRHGEWNKAQTVSGQGTDSINWSYSGPGPGDTLLWGENIILALPLDANATATGNQGLATPCAGNTDRMAVYRVPTYAGVTEATTGKKVVGNLTVLPNPLISGRAKVRLVVPQSGLVRLGVYDVGGRSVLARTLLAARGASNIDLDLRSLPAGMYLVRLTGDGFSSSQKFIVQR
jgi:DNA-binding beta-propeller fold protein YncE